MTGNNTHVHGHPVPLRLPDRKTFYAQTQEDPANNNGYRDVSDAFESHFNLCMDCSVQVLGGILSCFKIFLDAVVRTSTRIGLIAPSFDLVAHFFGFPSLP
jgi:hypothetical protein